VPASEWQKWSWGEQPAAFAGTADADEAQRLLLGQWNACVARADGRATTCPTRCRRCCGCPRIRRPSSPDDLDVGTDWAHGFFSAVELRPEAWQAWLDTQDWIDEIIEYLERLASGVVEGRARRRPAAEAQLQGAHGDRRLAADMLADLHQYKIECQRPPPAKRDPGKQDRNALCNCGSGKKYKHCHGRN
jgi:uncharacterized protein